MMVRFTGSSSAMLADRDFGSLNTAVLDPFLRLNRYLDSSGR